MPHPAPKYVTGGVRPCSLHAALLSNRKETERTGEVRKKKKNILLEKKKKANRSRSVRPIPPAGCYFYRVMNKPQYWGGGAGRAGLFTSAGAGRAERSSLSTARPLRAQWVPCAAQEACGGQQSRAGMQTGPGEAACEHTGWLLKMGEFSAHADKGGYSPRGAGAGVWERSLHACW